MDLANAFKDAARFGEVVLSGADHAELMALACKTTIVDQNVAHLIFPDEVQVERSDQLASGPDGRTASREICHLGHRSPRRSRGSAMPSVPSLVEIITDPLLM